MRLLSGGDLSRRCDYEGAYVWSRHLTFDPICMFTVPITTRSGREAGTELHGVGEQLAGRAEQVSGMFRRDATTQQEGASRAAAGRSEAHSGPEQGRSVHEVDIDSSGTRYFRVKHGGFLGIGS